MIGSGGMRVVCDLFYSCGAIPSGRWRVWVGREVYSIERVEELLWRLILGEKPEWPEPWSPAIANSFAIFSTTSVDEGEGGSLGACWEGPED